MNKECFQIWNGSLVKKQRTIFQDISMLVEKGSICDISGGSILEMDYLLDLLCGKEVFSGGRISVAGSITSREGNTEELGKLCVPVSGFHQLIDSVSVTDNFFSCSSSRQPFFARDRKNKAQLKELLERFRIQADVDMPSAVLSPLQNLQIQILKQYYHNPEKLVLVDRRKFLLSDTEFTQILGLMAGLCRQGMTFLILEYSADLSNTMIDRLIFIKNGRTVFQVSPAVTIKNRQIPETAVFREREKESDGYEENTVLQLDEIWYQHLHGLRFALKKGEFAEIRYTDSEAAFDFIQILNGSERPKGGTVRINGRPSGAESRNERVKEGITCIGDRGNLLELFENLKAGENYALPKGLKRPFIWLRRRYRRYLDKLLDKEAGRPVSSDYPADLDARDKLAVVFGAQKLVHPKVLVCLEPYGQVDQSLVSFVEEKLWELAEGGTAVLTLSRSERTTGGKQPVPYELSREGILLKGNRISEKVHFYDI